MHVPTDVEEATLRTLNAIDYIVGDACEPLSHLEGQLGSQNRREEEGVGTSFAYPTVVEKVLGDGKGLVGWGCLSELMTHG